MSETLNEALEQFDERLDREAPEGETPPEREQTERPRDEQGRFVAEEAEVAEEPEPETEPEPGEETPAEQLLAGKYKTAEDLERAYKELETRFGSQGSELGELRQAVESLGERIPEPQQGVQIDQNTVDWFDEQIGENPYGAAVWALRNDRSGVLYNRAMDAWYEEQPRAAGNFERQLAENQLRQEMAQQAQPLQEQEMARAFSTASQQHADVKEGLSEMLLSAAETNPVATNALIEAAHKADSYETRVEVFSSLIALAKGQRVDPVQATRDAQSAESEASRRAKQSGGVATQTQAIQAEKVDANEQWLRDNFDPYAFPEEIE